MIKQDLETTPDLPDRACLQPGTSVWYRATLSDFLAFVGSQATLIRSIVIRSSFMNTRHLRLINWQPDFDGSHKLVDLTTLVRGVWSSRLDTSLLDLSFLISCNPRHRPEFWYGLNQALYLILQDRPNIRRAMNHIDSIAVHGDGSGGVIVWRNSQNFGKDACAALDKGARGSFFLLFSMDNNGEGLTRLPRPHQGTIAALPRQLQNRIALESIPTITRLDLDEDLDLPYGIILTNRRFHGLREKVVSERVYELSMSSDQAQCDFDGFGRLKRPGAVNVS